MMGRQIILVTTLSISLFLVGCSSAPVLTKPSQSLDKIPVSSNAAYVSAQDQKIHDKIITKYIPVPLPGQLMPLPKDLNKQIQNQQFKTKEDAVNYANKLATAVPNSDDFFNSMMTYDFVEGQLYTIYAAPMHITDIVMQPGEKIISEAAGDTLRWQIEQTYSGDGLMKQQHLLVKPNNVSLLNSVVITTNKRVYHLLLKSTTNNTYMAEVRWNYPEDMLRTFKNDESSGGSGEADSNNSGFGGSPSGGSGSNYAFDLNKLDFNYKFGMVKGNKPGWYPKQVFNDGRQTFIEFSKDFYNSDMPILYVANNNGIYGTMLNYRTKGRYMIIDTVVKKARLQTGVKKTGQTIVQIESN